MTQQIINIGAVANDGSGDPLRTAFTKTNDNFTQLYERVQADLPATPAGKEGDLPGMIAFDETYLYVCIYAYDATSVIWYRVAFSTSPW